MDQSVGPADIIVLGGKVVPGEPVRSTAAEGVAIGGDRLVQLIQLSEAASYKSPV